MIKLGNRKKWILAPSLGSVVLIVLLLCVHLLSPPQPTHAVPPILQVPVLLNKLHEPNEPLHLQVTMIRGAVLLSIFNTSKDDIKLDIRPLCTLSGLKVFGIDTEGTRHEVEIAQFNPVYGWSLGIPCCADKAVIAGLEIVAIQPKQSFSWPTWVGHPKDWPSVMDEFTLPYKIDHYETILSLADGTELASKVKSNIFGLTLPSQQQRPSGTCPKKEFRQRLHLFRWSLRADEGARLASFFFFVEMRNKYLLSMSQFRQVLDAAVRVPCPLVRAQAAAFAETWQQLLVDANSHVRRQALIAAATSRKTLSYPKNLELVPVLLCKIQEGDSETKVLALKALANNSGGQGGRQFQDTINAARTDPDPNVNETAKRLFEWIK